MENLQDKIEYAVGLTREEYVRSQQVAMGILRGRRVQWQRVFSIVLLVMCVLTVGAEYRLTGSIPVDVAVLVTLMIIAELWVMLDSPRQLRKNHETAYDATLFSGHNFSGALEVTETGLIKRTEDETTRLDFAHCVAYIETADQLLFCVANGKSIVIPARCLTVEDAEVTKQLAKAAIPAKKQYLLAEIEPKLETRVPIGPLTREDGVMLSLSVEYTESELKSQLTDTAIRGFFAKFSSKMLTAVFFTVLFYFMTNTMPLPMFLSALLVLFLADIFFVRLRANRAITSSDGDVCRLTLSVTDRTLTVTGKGEKARRIRVPWERITRAVERPTEVEFYVEEARLVTIPKRCIPDMDEFRKAVDEKMKP